MPLVINTKNYVADGIGTDESRYIETSTGIRLIFTRVRPKGALRDQVNRIKERVDVPTQVLPSRAAAGNASAEVSFIIPVEADAATRTLLRTRLIDVINAQLTLDAVTSNVIPYSV